MSYDGYRVCRYRVEEQGRVHTNIEVRVIEL